MSYQSYHKHTHYSLTVPDSVVSPRDYALRAVELGHSLLSSVEHGWAGRYIESYELAKEYGLKFLFGTEAYWVKDRHEKDRTNNHIIVLAKNENGRKAINRILSEANITGFYYRARLDMELILSLPKDDVWLTSACVAGWKYEDAEDLFLQMFSYFGNNFFLEVQNHDTFPQKELNRKIIQLSNKHNIQIIFGVDSHFIYPEQAKTRDDYLLSKHIVYEDEEGWFLDYPSDEVAVERFVNQGVLTKAQIKEAMDNTKIFLQVEEYDSIVFNTDVKLPTLYPDKTQDEKNQIFIDLIQEKWEEEKEIINPLDWDKYEKEIDKEVQIVIDTKMSDYFLLDHKIVKRNEELGGMLTKTGRGSGPSFYIARLLGFTTIDRISAAVKLFPERFMTRERILDAHSLPDIDFNLGNPEVFAQAQIDVMGEGHSYPMLAFGTLRPKAAWKLYARAVNIEFVIANNISDQIGEYEKQLKYHDEQDVNVLNYIDYKYQEAYIQSQKYLGIVAQFGVHPCGFLIFSKNIKEEIGLIRIKNHLCVCMDGLWAEKYSFLKNDLLKVSVVDLIYRVYAKLNRKPHPLPELIKICDGNKKVWDIYKNATTVGINQVEGTSTSGRAAKYAPTNIAELSTFIAAIRPGFQSMYKIFEDREPFSYNVPALDDLIQSEDMPYSFMVYQEQAMNVLAYAGIPIAETYEVIKNIAKKRVEKVLAYKEKFIEGMTLKIMGNEFALKENAVEVAAKTWQIIEDSSSYLFNASHSYSVAGDSLYGAYLKSHYPIKFYETLIEMLQEDGSKDRLVRAIEEAEKEFGIKFPRYRFGQDNRTIKGDVEKWEITVNLTSIKGFSSSIGNHLYELGLNKYDSFLEFLIDAEEKGYTSKKYEDLIQINYFEEFGSKQTLFKFFKIFIKGKARYSRKHTDKTKTKRIELLKEIWESLPDEKLPIWEQLGVERDILGYIHAIYPHINRRFIYVMNLNEKFAPRIQAYRLDNGKQASLKILTKVFENNKFVGGDILYMHHVTEKPSVSYVNGSYPESPTEKTLWLDSYNILTPEEFDEVVSRVK